MTAVVAPPGRHPSLSTVDKAPTGVRGFDELTAGGLPRGRATLVAGGPGAGKSLLGLEFVVRGSRDFGEPGVLLTFEESAEEVVRNAASIGLDLAAEQSAGRLVVDAVRLDPGEVVLTGAFDLDGLFIRLAAAIDLVGAQRVVLDTVEVLFAALEDVGTVRAEFARLLRWLKDRGLTTLVTAERGQGAALSRYGIEEYVSDCVVVLDHRVRDEVATRRLRVVKYRGSGHGTNEYPFLIRDRGLTVLPITSVQLDYEVSTERVSLGVDRLDAMLGGGVYRGSTVLVSGGVGTGKTTLAAHAVDTACRRGERALFVSYEEAPAQLVRNLRSVGLDLGHWVTLGGLRLWGERATAAGLEGHVAGLEDLLDDLRPDVVVLDSVASLHHVGPVLEVASALARLLDLLKSRRITAVVTNLTHGEPDEVTWISSLVDTWLLVRNLETDGERNRLLFVMKSRGAAHSNQVREFRLTDHGIDLLDVRVGPQGVLTGSARARYESHERTVAVERSAGLEQRRLALARREAEVDAEIALLRERLATQRAEIEGLEALGQRSDGTRAQAEAQMARDRQRGPAAPGHEDPGG